MRPARVLYNGAGLAALAVAWPYVLCAGLRRKNEWKERLGYHDYRLDDSIWVHAASVGEVQAATPLVRAIREVTETPVFVTTVTATGQRTAKTRVPSEYIAFAPLDLLFAVTDCIDRVKPRCLILLESEVWPNLIEECTRLGAGVALVNARMSESSMGWYKRASFLFGRTLDCISLFAAQSESDAGNIRGVIGTTERVEVTGNLKYDNLLGRPTDEARSRLRSELGLNSQVLVAGSVRGEEICPVLDTAARIKEANRAQTVLAPRHMKWADRIVRECESRGLAVARRSKRPEPGFDVLLVDTTGELNRIYGAGDVAFVGGSIAPIGGHNPMEPAAVGVPVIFGSHMENCRPMADSLIEHCAAIEVDGVDGLTDAAVRLLSEDERRDEMSSRCLEVVRGLKGASQRTVDALLKRGILG